MPDEIQGLKEGSKVPLSDNIEITELHCHDCDGYIKFALDKGKSGEHIVICPKCKHQHCRVIKDGKVLGDRWASRNPDTPAPSGPTPTYFVQVSINNWSQQGFQTVDPGGTGGTSCHLKEAWMSTDSNATAVASATGYWIVGTGGSTAT